MSLTPFVQIVARGKGRARPLSFDEAQAAMVEMLRDHTPMEAVGALLMVLRLRGETPDEIAGFTAGLQDSAPLPPADLDWPSYAAGRTRGAPLFLLSARLVAQAGYRVAMHGYNSHQSTAADLRRVMDATQIIGGGLSYTPLEQLSPAALRLLRLRDTLGLRSCINTVLRMWNPSRAPATVQGVFHPSYRSLQAQAGVLLDARNMSIIKGGGGEFERHPGKAVNVFGLRDGAHFEALAPALRAETRKLHELDQPVDAVFLWAGDLVDPFSEAIVTSTAGLALWTLGAAQNLSAAEHMAADLWATRHNARPNSSSSSSAERISA